jgi:dTDP-4-dehydrorhamnose reductase
MTDKVKVPLKVLLLGSTGMLGNYILKYLKLQNITTICIKCDAENKIENIKQNIKEHITENVNCVIINCIGLIPQTGELDDLKYLKINSIFPKYLDIISNELNCKLIHITTDCVFDGTTKESYDEDSIKNEKSIYGMSKILGENLQNATIIRTSIIGETFNGRVNKSLLEWVRSNKNGSVNGFTNHFWNGVTCLQLAKIINEIIITNEYWIGIRHIYSPNVVSKYDLICIINEIYNLNINIIPSKGDYDINKSLKSKYSNRFVIPDLEIQIKEMYAFLK